MVLLAIAINIDTGTTVRGDSGPFFIANVTQHLIMFLIRMAIFQRFLKIK